MIPLRQYQVDCVEAVRAAFRQGLRRIILQMDTGGGKTIVACEMVRRTIENSNRCLFLAHARELVNQCSDKLDKYDIWHGILMAGRGYRLDEPVQVGSTGTLISRVIRRQVLKPPEAQLLILDECHRQGEATRALIKKYPKAVIIGLTATPCRTDGRGLGGPGGYQKIIQAVPRSRLIADGYLVPTRTYGPYNPDMTVTKDERARGVRATGTDGDFSVSFRSSRMDKPELIGDIVSHWKRLGEGRPTIFFGASVSHSVHTAAAFNAAGIPAVHLDANSDDQARQAVLGGPDGPGSLETGKLKVACNYGVLVEGIDVPAVGCIIMGRPTKSFIVYKQAVGRACRPYDGPLYKKLYAILLDHAGNWERFQPYGLPDTDIDWELDEKKTVDQKQKEKEPNAARIITCPECFALFKAAPSCPECGHVMKKQRSLKDPAENKAGLLVEVGKTQHQEALRQEKLRRAWQKALAIAAARDGSCGMAASIFKSETGILPWNAPQLPHLPVRQEDWKKSVRTLFPNFYRGGLFYGQ